MLIAKLSVIYMCVTIFIPENGRCDFFMINKEFDVFATDENGKPYDIEIQRADRGASP